MPDLNTIMQALGLGGQNSGPGLSAGQGGMLPGVMPSAVPPTGGPVGAPGPVLPPLPPAASTPAPAQPKMAQIPPEALAQILASHPGLQPGGAQPQPAPTMPGVDPAMMAQAMQAMQAGQGAPAAPQSAPQPTVAQLDSTTGPALPITNGADKFQAARLQSVMRALASGIGT